jgi:hypothetical protein
MPKAPPAPPKREEMPKPPAPEPKAAPAPKPPKMTAAERKAAALEEARAGVALPSAPKITPTQKRKIDAAFREAKDFTDLVPLARDKSIPLAELLKRAKDIPTQTQLFFARHPDVTTIGWETQGLDKAMTAQAMGTVSNLLDHFPEVKLPRLEANGTKTAHVGMGTIAYVRGKYYKFDQYGRLDRKAIQNTEMVVSTHYLEDAGRTERLRENSHSGHFHDVGDDPMAYILAHEFGHALDNQMDKAGAAAMSSAKRAWLAQRKAGKSTPWTMSRYGQTNPAEGFAEAFADVYINGAKAKPLSTQIVQDALLKGRSK